MEERLVIFKKDTSNKCNQTSVEWRTKDETNRDLDLVTEEQSEMEIEVKPRLDMKSHGLKIEKSKHDIMFKT